MKICIVGFGNIGSAIAGRLSLSGHDVRVFTSTELGQDCPFTLKEMDSTDERQTTIALVTNDLETAVADIDMLIVTYPSFMLEAFAKKVEPFLIKPIFFGIVPGSGGAEYITKKIFTQKHVIFGLDRVPYIARLIEKNHSVEFSKKASVNVAAIPKKETAVVARMLEELLRLPIYQLQNFLEVSLTPSNAILHTSRIYSMFKDYATGVTYPKIPYFYRDWTLDSSESLIALDQELKNIILKMPELDLSEIKTIREHYESPTAKAMTDKIKSISSFRNIISPMKQLSDQTFVPDFTSRYFTEDLPFGLLIIKGFGLITEVETPEADKIILWSQKWLNKEYLTNEGKPGQDFFVSGVPQAYGIKTLEDVYHFYQS
ncbi:NAD/NADP octopine/nopaline dehydrogenase family protein [Enterococcus rotai]|uniref:NAD/NADP octopine/nopaline dehydrogenase family protein n=1 Tax=Enterococcus rotai TaxID=118060 RepID=UPI0032B4F84E